MTRIVAWCLGFMKWVSDDPSYVTGGEPKYPQELFSAVDLLSLQFLVERMNSTKTWHYRLKYRLAAFRAEEMPSLISCWMAAKVMAGVSDVDVLLGGILSTQDNAYSALCLLPLIRPSSFSQWVKRWGRSRNEEDGDIISSSSGNKENIKDYLIVVVGGNIRMKSQNSWWSIRIVNEIGVFRRVKRTCFLAEAGNKIMVRAEVADTNLLHPHFYNIAADA
ncbi:hypothetical protein Tco_0889163 [Tanacetum coccineum]